MCDLVVAALHEEGLRARRPAPSARQEARHGSRAPIDRSVDDVAIAGSASKPAPPQQA